MTGRSAGDRGEDLALEYLEGRGFELVERNYRSRYGEIDIIMLDGESLVFVEVKLRRSVAHGDPLEFVTPKKQEKLRITAEQYLAGTKIRYEEVRFDVVGIVDGSRTVLDHVRDAF